MDEQPKKRTMDELRQVKTYGYTPQKTKVISRRQDFYRKVNFDCQHIVDLIQEYPNETELGKEIIKYYNSLKG